MRGVVRAVCGPLIKELHLRSVPIARDVLGVGRSPLAVDRAVDGLVQYIVHYIVHT